MATIIKCRTNNIGKHNFYIEHLGKEYYLFSQDYHRGVNIYFAKGVNLNNVLNIKTAKRDHKVIKTMSKMKMYIKYIENEYDINILKCTMKKGEIKKRGCIKNYHEFNEYFIKTSYIKDV